MSLVAALPDLAASRCKVARWLGILVLVLAAPASAWSQTPECSKTQAREAEEGVGALESWRDLYAAFERFHVCDDGAIGEGWSDFTVRMLASNWRTLNQLQQLVSMDRNFRAFVVRHIDTTADTNDLRLALSNSVQHCPRGARELCESIAVGARRALERH